MFYAQPKISLETEAGKELAVTVKVNTERCPQQFEVQHVLQLWGESIGCLRTVLCVDKRWPFLTHTAVDRAPGILGTIPIPLGSISEYIAVRTDYTHCYALRCSS